MLLEKWFQQTHWMKDCHKLNLLETHYLGSIIKQSTIKQGMHVFSNYRFFFQFLNSQSDERKGNYSFYFGNQFANQISLY